MLTSLARYKVAAIAILGVNCKCQSKLYHKTIENFLQKSVKRTQLCTRKSCSLALVVLIGQASSAPTPPSLFPVSIYL